MTNSFDKSPKNIHKVQTVVFNRVTFIVNNLAFTCSY